MRQQESQGLFYIILGALLLMYATSDIVLRLLAGICAITLIGKGLQLMGYPPLYYIARSFFDRFNR